MGGRYTLRLVCGQQVWHERDTYIVDLRNKALLAMLFEAWVSAIHDTDAPPCWRDWRLEVLGFRGSVLVTVNMPDGSFTPSVAFRTPVRTG